MNIFVINENPESIAKDLTDKHVVKMILETAQMLCSKYHEQRLEAPYKRTHFNHPCTVWSRHSQANYLWLLDLGLSLAIEYTKRFAKIHKSQEVIEYCFDNLKLLKFSNVGLTTPPACMPSKYVLPNSHKWHQLMLSYRIYYAYEKLEVSSYKHSQRPKWLDHVR